MLSLDVQRQVERKKYDRAYQEETYAMGALRMSDAVRALRGIPNRGNYLDVGCGRGEMIRAASGLGFAMCRGTEVVEDLIDGERVLYAEAHLLPFEDNSFETVSMFDVIEHLLPGDDELAIRELSRVAKKHVLVTANNLSSSNAVGDDLHVNRREYDRWHALFHAWFSVGAKISMATDLKYVSKLWRVDLV